MFCSRKQSKDRANKIKLIIGHRFKKHVCNDASIFRKKRKTFEKGHVQYQKQRTIVIENSDELTIGWSEVMIQYRSLAVPPHIIKIHTIFSSVTNAFNVYIYTDMPPRFKCVLSTRASRVHVVDPLACFVYIRVFTFEYIYIYKYMCEPHVNHHHHLGSSFDIIGASRKTRNKGARDGGRWPWIPGCVCFCRWRPCRFGPVPFYGLHLQRRLLHIEELRLRRIRRLPTGRRRASLRYIKHLRIVWGHYNAGENLIYVETLFIII